MTRLIILEGARCTGKSTIAQKLRQQGINYATLINFTGFPDDGANGLDKITKYYRSWIEFFRNLKGQDITFIADRMFFSEMVFSYLYKSYSFGLAYISLCADLVDVIDQLDLLLFTVDAEALETRIKRENKVEFAGVGDDISEIMKQQKEYLHVFSDFCNAYYAMDYVNVYDIFTSNKTQEEVYKTVLDVVNNGGSGLNGIISE